MFVIVPGCEHEAGLSELTGTCIRHGYGKVGVTVAGVALHRLFHATVRGVVAVAHVVAKVISCRFVLDKM